MFRVRLGVRHGSIERSRVMEFAATHWWPTLFPDNPIRMAPRDGMRMTQMANYTGTYRLALTSKDPLATTNHICFTSLTQKPIIMVTYKPSSRPLESSFTRQSPSPTTSFHTYHTTGWSAWLPTYDGILFPYLWHHRIPRCRCLTGHRQSHGQMSSDSFQIYRCSPVEITHV